MIKKFLKDKTWRSWSPARDRWWAHSTTHWQSRLSHSGKYRTSPSALCGSCKKNKAVTARPDSYEFRCTTLVASKTINVSGQFARKHSAMDAFTSSQDGHGGSRPSLEYKKLIHFLKGEWHTSLRHTKSVCHLLLQPPEPVPQTGHHEQLVFKGHHRQPTRTSHVLPASFLVRSTHLAEDFLLHLNTQRFPESFPLDDRNECLS